MNPTPLISHFDFANRASDAVVRDGQAHITAVAPSKTFNIRGLGLSCLIAPEPAHRDAQLRDFLVQQARVGMSPGAVFGQGAAASCASTSRHRAMSSPKRWGALRALKSR